MTRTPITRFCSRPDRAPAVSSCTTRSIKWVFNRHPSDSDSPTIVRAKSAAQPGVWTHLTGSYDADEQSVSLHVNGRLQESAEFTSSWRAPGALQLGRLGGAVPGRSTRLRASTRCGSCSRW
ncbi:LamG-like jellyroll fold domain-containing protein [Streptomyces xinghaiensis]|uniref:LamG-like jellyroll fold domain-containing protein n=1 Tax=Streptomyces xinghaiensis TaxID=1038928 RepID=UPI00342418FE